MNKKRKMIIQGNNISEVLELDLGGYNQKVLIEGKSNDLPVVISLHGGPGMPIPFCVGGRGLFPEFTDRCILVSWDQYGCGINNAKLPEDISINSFKDMTVDLIRAMKSRFPDNKLILLAMSWGSVLSALAISEVYELTDGVIAYGQVLCELMQSKETIDALMKSKAPEKLKAEINDAVESKEFNPKTAMKLSNALRKYTDGYVDKNEPKADMKGMIKGIMTSPDYRFKDFMAMVMNGYRKNTSLIKELSVLDLHDVLKKVKVPYHIIQGKSDIVTCTNMIKKFVDSAENENLTCKVIPDSAHIPGMNGMNAVLKEIINLK